MRRWLARAFAATAVALPAHVLADESSTSAALAARLVDALAARQVDSWAAPDPADPGRFVAVLHVPGSQLLVVSARPTAPASLEYRLAMKDYRQAYAELQTSAVEGGTFFVQDMAADGFSLDAGRNGAVDVVYENADTRTLLNGDWKAQDLSEAEYVRRRAAAEERYAAMLSSLLSSIDAEAGSAPRTTAAESQSERQR
jgi:hypothetical protein